MRLTIRAALFYFSTLLMFYSTLGLVAEFIAMPLLAWIGGGGDYSVGGWERIYIWLKLVPFASAITFLCTWRSYRKSMGR